MEGQVLETYADKKLKQGLQQVMQPMYCSGFSIHLAAYVASLIFFVSSKLSIPLISPIVPMDIKSSISLSPILYFFAIYATNLRFLSIRQSLAPRSPDLHFSMHSFSSFALKGLGKDCTSDTSNSFTFILCNTPQVRAFPSFYYFPSAALFYMPGLQLMPFSDIF